MGYTDDACYYPYVVWTGVCLLVIAYRILYPPKILRLPPGPFNLPIVGYLPFLGEYPHKKLKELSEIYGNVFRLNLGTTSTVIVADFEALKEAFSKSATLDRPPNLFHDMPDGLGLTSVNGIDWYQQRIYTFKAMRDLGLGKSGWQYFVQDEVDEFLHLLKTQEGKPFDIKPPLISSISNNMFSLVFGYRLPLDHPKMAVIIKAVHSFPNLFTQTGFLCMVPGIIGFLKKIGFDFLKSEMKDVTALNSLIREEINLKKEEMNEANENCFVDGYLKKMNDNELFEESSFNESYLVGNIQSLLYGGTETTLTTLTWLSLAMVTYPRIQDKVQEELDTVLGRSNRPQWADRSKFPYTYATILECMRWRTVVPMNMQRMTTEDIKIRGYDVPKGTAIIGFLFGVQTNCKTWPNPDSFIPERFIDPNGGLVTKLDGWVPFSYGKRNCPGETASMIEIFLYFASIMQKFSISNVDEEQPPDLDTIVSLNLVPKQSTFKFISRI